MGAADAFEFFLVGVCGVCGAVAKARRATDADPLPSPLQNLFSVRNGKR